MTPQATLSGRCRVRKARSPRANPGVPGRRTCLADRTGLADLNRLAHPIGPAARTHLTGPTLLAGLTRHARLIGPDARTGPAGTRSTARGWPASRVTGWAPAWGSADAGAARSAANVPGSGLGSGGPVAGLDAIRLHATNRSGLGGRTGGANCCDAPNWTGAGAVRALWWRAAATATRWPPRPRSRGRGRRRERCTRWRRRRLRPDGSRSPRW